MERLIKNGSAEIWTTTNGSGIPFILCNGGPGCDDYLGPVSDMVEDMCQVIRFEPRGCGRSTYDGNYDLDTTIEDIEFIRREYQCDRMIIGGHSAGPGIALAYTIRYPERVMGLVGISGGNILNDRDWSHVYSKNLEEVGESYGGQEFIADPDVNKIGNRSWKKYIQRPELLGDIAKLEVPAVFINAENDIRPSWPTQQLANLIPKGEYHKVAGAAHCIWLTHYDELKNLLRRNIAMIIEGR
jgi:proline iminopeptidase|tara:strand:- start:4287 stop:5012 length:726 start_codon:yes stop_codon:yes gene_type:complete